MSAYLGDISLGGVILNAIPKVKAVKPRAIFCCDPVTGDVGWSFFVREVIPEVMRGRAVPAADLVTLNRLELEYMTGVTAATLDKALTAANWVRALGPNLVLITSLMFEDEPVGVVEITAVSGEGV